MNSIAIAFQPLILLDIIVYFNSKCNSVASDFTQNSDHKRMKYHSNLHAADWAYQEFSLYRSKQFLNQKTVHDERFRNQMQFDLHWVVSKRLTASLINSLFKQTMTRQIATQGVQRECTSGYIISQAVSGKSCRQYHRTLVFELCTVYNGLQSTGEYIRFIE